MRIRNPELRDDERLVEIYESFYSREFPIDLSTAFASVVAEKGNKIVGFGWLSATVEANVILDLNARPRDKFDALRSIIDHGSLVPRYAGFDQLHAYPGDKRFSGILAKHLNFKFVESDCLVKNLR